MLRTVDLRGTRHDVSALRALMPRATFDPSAAIDSASESIADVRRRGSEALREQAERFDGDAPAHIRVRSEAMIAALRNLDPQVRTALETEIDRVRRVSLAQIPTESRVEVVPGGVVTQRWVPVERVGLYVPGGKAVYPSSVVMNAVPALVAGVSSLALVSPPQVEFEASVHPTVLATAELLGLSEVYAMGGAGAIGALAYGVADLGLEPVDVITGPGNRYVAAAKRLVRGVVGIDAEAGPTEILVIADASANAALIAADLISQAEHDDVAASVLVTDAPVLAMQVADALNELALKTRHSERVATALSGEQSAVILVDDMDAAVAVSNAYAPEHLEIHTSNPDLLLADVRDAGAVFVGAYSPVSLGDYLAGSNHVLPTVGQARFSAALGAYTFLRAQQVVRYDAHALEQAAPLVRALADSENLPAHGDAIDARFANGKI